MFAYGIGVRQLATRIALYWDAKDARSAEVVPGMPLGSDAPGAPAVEPPMADGHVGAAGCVGGGVGVSLIAAGVVVNVRPATSELVAVALNDGPLVVTALVEALVEDDDEGADAGAAGVVDVLDRVPAATAAMAVFVSDVLDNATAEVLAVKVTPPAGEMAGIEEPAP